MVTSGRPEALVIRRGETVALPDGVAKVLGYARGGDLTVTVLLDFGDRTERRPWRTLIDDARITHERANPPSPDEVILADLSVAERRDLEDMVRHLRQIIDGSPTGTADVDRDMGLLDPRYDPKTTSRSQRLHARCSTWNAPGAQGGLVQRSSAI